MDFVGSFLSGVASSKSSLIQKKIGKDAVKYREKKGSGSEELLEPELETFKSEPDDKNSQFIQATANGNYKMLMQLSKNIEDLDIEYIRIAEDIAFEKGNSSIIGLTQVILDRKKKSTDKNSKLLEAVAQGDINLLTLLSSNIEDLDLQYIKTAEEIALEHGNAAIITLTQLILENKMPQSRLCSAVSEGDHMRVVRALRYGADPNTCMPWEFGDHLGGKHKRVPVLTVAVYKGYVDVVTALLDYNANTELSGDYLRLPLATAVAEGHTKIVEKLLVNGAGVNTRNSKHGWSPIHYAACKDHVKIAQVLKDHKSDLGAVDNAGRTPLHEAAWFGSRSVAEWLIQKGVDVAALNYDGKTAADRAESRGHKELATVLRLCEHSAFSAQNKLRTKKPVCMDKIQHRKKKVYVMNYFEFTRKEGATTDILSLKRREGAEMDSKSLQLSFEKLGYEFILSENMTENQTMDFLDNIQQDKSLEFLLLIILSRGWGRDSFITSDGAVYNLEQIQYLFTDKNCHQLQGKAKIILSNFSRVENISKISCDSIPSRIIRDETPHHMITIHACHEGFKPARWPASGTFFVQNLCKVLDEGSNLTIFGVFDQVYDKLKIDLDQTPEMRVSAPLASFTF